MFGYRQAMPTPGLPRWDIASRAGRPLGEAPPVSVSLESASSAGSGSGVVSSDAWVLVAWSAAACKHVRLGFLL